MKHVRFLSFLTGLSLALGFSHQYVASEWYAAGTFFYPVYAIYLFHFVATLLIYFFLVFVHRTLPEKTGFAFLATTVVKMGAAIVFLLPLIQSGKTDRIPDAVAFFVPYFIFLFLETLFAIRLINAK